MSEWKPNNVIDKKGIKGIEIESQETSSQFQVYSLTHDSSGKYTSYIDRAYISFTYGGKHIEDFNLICTINDARMQRDNYANFNDIVTDSEILDGQHHWKTHFKANNLSLNLSTDGMTQEQYDEFNKWFIPGIKRELVLSEHPNRAIMARISQAPTSSIIPFKHIEKIKLMGKDKEIVTTLYKGDISLNFVMDDPFWYSLKNIFYYKGIDSIDYEKWVDANSEVVAVYNDPDALKIVLEDRVPFLSMIEGKNISVGGNGAANSLSYGILLDNGDGIAQPGEAVLGLENTKVGPIGESDLVEDTDIGITLEKNAYAYFFYGGNAPCKPILKFQLTPMFNQEKNYSYNVSLWRMITNESGTYREDLGTFIEDGFPTYQAAEDAVYQLQREYDSLPMMAFLISEHSKPDYIISPKNSFYLSDMSSSQEEKSYNTITIESENKKEFKFTTPSIWTGYNQAIKIIKQSINLSFAELQRAIKIGVNHFAPRAWAIAMIMQIQQEDSILVKQEDIDNILNNMQNFFQDDDSKTMPATFTFNFQSGEFIGEFKYRSYINSNNFEIKSIKENVGDMVRSEYLIIDERNNFDYQGIIKNWEDTPEGRKYSYRVYHNVDNGLENFSIKYKYLYL